MTYTLTLVPTGTVDRTVTKHPNLVEARRALVTEAADQRINTHGDNMSGTLTYADAPGLVHQATTSWIIREESAS